MKKAYFYLMVCTMSVILSISAEDTKISDTKILFNSLYSSINGFDLASGESEEMAKQDGASTYGEILWDSLKTIIDYLKISKDDVFVDLGSGVGKVVLQTYLTTPAKKCIGVELAKTRHDKAESVKTELKNKGKLVDNRILEYLNKNIKDVDLSDVTIVFMCSTCFSDSLMQSILDKLNSNKQKNLRIVTLKQLPANDQFKLDKTFTLPMTWSNGTQVNIYTRK